VPQKKQQTVNTAIRDTI